MTRSGETPTASEVVGWLLTTGVQCENPASLLHHYCGQLRAARIPLDRSTLGAPLLHPVAQSSYVFWSVEEGATQHWFKWTPDTLETMRASPIYPLYERGEGSRLLLGNEEDRDRYPIGADLHAEGYVEYDAIPLRFSDGMHKALTVATKHEAGFSDGDLGLIEETLPALSVVFEGFIARNTARTLMETYVGSRAGARVLDGEIARGDGSAIDAVILFCDLREFTRLSSALSEQDLLDLLNNYFQVVVEAVEDQEGEVLKFIGDAILAIFPSDDDPADAVARAEAACLTAFGSASDMQFSFGIAIHRGEVFYGNIGGGLRQDFTVIGRDVNIASRVEALCSQTGFPLLATPSVRAVSKRHWQDAGEHMLKGVSEPVTLYRLDPDRV